MTRAAFVGEAHAVDARAAPPGPVLPDLPQGAHCHAWLHLLDEHEQRRAAAFIRPADRRLYLKAHVGTRLILGRYTRRPPGELHFDRSCDRCDAEHGKPRLASPEAPIHFSYSHSGDLALLAVAAFPVGVDVQIIDGRIAVDTLAETVLSAPELSRFRRLTDSVRRQSFFLAWSRKEAVLKATGDGLRVPMSDLVVAAEDRRPSLAAWRGRPTVPRIQLCDVSLGDHEYVGAVAGVTKQPMISTCYSFRD